MHPKPRSAADILASAKSAPPNKSHKPAKLNPLASDPQIFFDCNGFDSTSTHSSTPVPFLNISTETATGPYVPPTTFKFIPSSTPDTFLKARGKKREEDSDIADSCFFEESLRGLKDIKAI